MRSELKNIYRRVALMLCLSLMVGILPESSDAVSASSPTVKLIIKNKNVTKKTYKLKNKLGRQLGVKTNNTFGRTTIKFTSSNKKKATVTSNGYIKTKKTGTVKIKVKVTCRSGRKKRSTTTWTKIKIIANDADATPTPSPTSQLGGAMQAVLIVNGTNAKQFPMTILDNASGRMFYNALPKTLYLQDSNKNTKTGEDPDGLYYPMEEYKPKTLLAGDFMLFGNSRYELTYEDHTSGYAYTRLGRIMNPTGLKDALGTGPASVTIIRSTIPATTSPLPTLTPKPSPTITPSGSPGVSGSPKPSTSPGVSASPGASGSPKPSTSPGASSSPGASGSPKPSTSPTPTPIPSYTGPRIRIEVNGQDYFVKVNTSSSVAMNFYNGLSKDRERNVPMKTFDDRMIVGMFDSGLSNADDVNDNKNWGTGNVILRSGYIYIVKQTVSSTEARSYTLIGSADETMHSLEDLRKYLGTMFMVFDISQGFNVNFWKD